MIQPSKSGVTEHDLEGGEQSSEASSALVDIKSNEQDGIDSKVL